MSTHQDPLQGAVVLAVTMMSAGLNGAFDALIGMTIHVVFLLFTEFSLSIGGK